MTPAQEIGTLVNRILALAPKAGLYIGIKIEPARDSDTRPKDGDAKQGSTCE